jgi:hypothetical protein
MKSKLIIVSIFASILAMSALFAFSSNAQAHEGWRHGGGHYVYRPNYGWVVPAVVGGVIVYEATRPPVTVIQQSPVYIQQPYPPVFPQPADMHWEAILDSNCNCYRTVLVPNR